MDCKDKSRRGWVRQTLNEHLVSGNNRDHPVDHLWGISGPSRVSAVARRHQLGPNDALNTNRLPGYFSKRLRSEGWGQNNPDSCPVSRGTPILQFNNTMDSLPPLEGGDWPTPSKRTSRTLRKYTDYSIREISRRTGVPKSTVFEHTNRTKEQN
jgi:hypothetical protein